MTKKINKNEFAYPITEASLQKKTNDLLYGYLLLKSHFTKLNLKGVGMLNNTRIINKDDIVLSEISTKLYGNADKSTKIETDLNKLEKIGLLLTIYPAEWVKLNGDIPYHFLFEKFSPFVLLSKETLEFFIESRMKNALKVYCYLSYKNSLLLYKNSKTGEENNYKFTINNILRECFQLKNTSNSKSREEVVQIIDFLNSCGLIKTEKEYYRDIYYKYYYKYTIISISNRKED